MSAPPDLSSLRIARDGDGDQPRAARRRWPIVLAVVAAVAAAAALALPRLSGTSGVQVATGTVVVVGGNAPVAGGLTANGYVVAERKAEVAPKITGVLAELRVTEGSEVKAGDIIAQIESKDFVAQLQAAKAAELEAVAQEARAVRELDRSRALREQAVVAQAALDEAQSNVDVARAKLAFAKAQVALQAANLESTRVRAPFSGTVLRKSAEVGELVGPVQVGGAGVAQGLVTLADLAALEVEADVNEAYIGRVQKEQPARVVLDAYSDAAFEGQVRQVVPTADRQKATVQVKVRILDKDPRILPEMAAKVTFLPKDAQQPAAKTPRQVLVPSAAVVHESTGPVVYVVEGDVVRVRRLKLGQARGEDVAVESGLDGGETVVLSPSQKLEDGTRVRVGS